MVGQEGPDSLPVVPCNGIGKGSRGHQRCQSSKNLHVLVEIFIQSEPPLELVSFLVVSGKFSYSLTYWW